MIDDKKVRVDWDSAPDIAGSEAGGIGEARLLPSKWNKDNIVGAWRFDVDIYEGDELDDGIGAQEEEELDSSDSEPEEESVE